MPDEHISLLGICICESILDNIHQTKSQLDNEEHPKMRLYVGYEQGLLLAKSAEINAPPAPKYFRMKDRLCNTL